MVAESAEPNLAHQAEQFHNKQLQPSEGIAIGEIQGTEANFGSAGLLSIDGPSVDENTLFEIGSITKVFTGILLADAVLKKQASLNDPIIKYLKDELPEDCPVGKVTLFELSTHTSGLPRIPGDLLLEKSDPDDPYAHYGEKELFDYLLQFEEGDFESPGKFSYSNLGVGLLGVLLERISGKPYEILLAEIILTPLGMNDTFVQRHSGDIPPAHTDRFATGHRGGQPLDHWNIDALCAAGAIVSTANDMITFAEANWSSDTPAPLSHAMTLAATRQAGRMGLGWHISGKGLFHNGGTGGFLSELTVSPEDQTARISLRNSAGPAKPPAPKGDFASFAGFWVGTLKPGNEELPLILRIIADGTILLYSLEQSNAAIPGGKTEANGTELTVSFPALNGSLEVMLKGRVLRGVWTQGESIPLVLTRSPRVPAPLQEMLKAKVKGETRDLAGYWSGFLGGKDGLFIILHLEWLWGSLDPKIYSPDQTSEPIDVSKLSFDGQNLTLTQDALQASFRAKLTSPHTLEGIWDQGEPAELELKWTRDRPSRDSRP